MLRHVTAQLSAQTNIVIVQFWGEVQKHYYKMATDYYYEMATDYYYYKMATVLVLLLTTNY